MKTKSGIFLAAILFIAGCSNDPSALTENNYKNALLAHYEGVELTTGPIISSIYNEWADDAQSQYMIGSANYSGGCLGYLVEAGVLELVETVDHVKKGADQWERDKTFSHNHYSPTNTGASYYDGNKRFYIGKVKNINILEAPSTENIDAERVSSIPIKYSIELEDMPTWVPVAATASEYETSNCVVKVVPQPNQFTARRYVSLPDLLQGKPIEAVLRRTEEGWEVAEIEGTHPTTDFL